MMILAFLLWAQLPHTAAEPVDQELLRLLPQAGAFIGRSQLLFAENGNRTRFVYTGADGVIEYCLQPGNDFWGPVIVKVNRIPVAAVLEGATPRFDTPIEEVRFVRRWAEEEALCAEWAIRLNGREERVLGRLRLIGKSLAVEYSSSPVPIAGATVGPIEAMAGMTTGPEPLDPGGECPARLAALDGIKTAYASLIPGAGTAWDPDTELLSAGAGAGPAPDAIGSRDSKPQHEIRFFLTLSPSREEVLPPGCRPSRD